MLLCFIIYELSCKPLCLNRRIVKASQKPLMALAYYTICCFPWETHLHVCTVQWHVCTVHHSCLHIGDKTGNMLYKPMEHYVCLSCCNKAVCVWCLYVHDSVILQGELKLTVLISWESGKGVIHSHVAALPQRPQPPVKVQVSHFQTVNHGNKLYPGPHGLQSQTDLGTLAQELYTLQHKQAEKTGSVALTACTRRELPTAACILLMLSTGADVILPRCCNMCCQNRLQHNACMHAA